MHILVAGATGYVGSRLVPELVRRGHRVAAASTDGVDAVCYLVRSPASRGFREADRVAAATMRDAVARNGVGRLVYLSALVPDVPRDELSLHVASRLEVEEILLDCPAATLSLRAGMIIGAGSTSFEILRQSTSALPVQPVPLWMRSRVQPIAAADLVRALADALEGDAVGTVDVGGPDVVTYPELLALYAELAGLARRQVPVLAPVTAVALSAGLVSAAPYRTAAALVESLRHDMVCRPGQPDPAKVDLTDALPLREAIEQALLPDGRAGRASGRDSGDPAWVRPSVLERSVTATGLPGTTVLAAALHIAEHRVRGLLGLVS
ncbi:MAG: hypothetical protein QOF53_1776 [Nocardioidaceae bacterium]|nr:hypothetical protein [Nocardioidaceae bacterium]